jgi:predicted short-subunit dehydrogenase-like oxidoreductase (DUF2520 family)
MRSRIVAALAAPALLALAFITVAFTRGAAVRRGVAVAVRAAAVGSRCPRSVRSLSGRIRSLPALQLETVADQNRVP